LALGHSFIVQNYDEGTQTETPCRTSLWAEIRNLSGLPA
jgi:hypothetical protein